MSGVGEASEVADVGTGTGFVAAGIAPRVRRVIGIDNAPAMLEVARENLLAFTILRAYHPPRLTNQRILIYTPIKQY